MVADNGNNKFDNSKKMLNLSFIPWASLFFFLVTQFTFNGHIIYSHIAYSSFVLMAMIVVFYRKGLRVCYSHYFTTFVLFMLFSFVLMVFGRAMYPDAVWEKLKYMSVNLVIYFALYNFIIESDNRELLFKLTILAAVIALAYIMLSVEDIWTGRLGHTMSAENPSFFVNGIPVYLTGNSISTFTGIGALFSLYFVGIYKKRLYILPYLFLAFGTLLSGSRKGLLILGLFTVYALFVYFKGANISKLFKIVIALAVLYVLIMKVPAFYELIGKRTEALIATFLGMEAEESSMDYRMYLAGLAKDLIAQKPFFGWGLFNFPSIINSRFSVDNNYLDILVSCGVFGLIIYYSYVLVALKMFFSLSSNKRTVLTRTMFFVLLCFLILDAGSVMYAVRTQLIWVVVFFAFATIDLRKEFYANSLKIRI